MPTTVTKVVDTGGTGDYTSLSACEAAMQQDLVTNDVLIVIECEASGGVADGPATFAGSVTDLTRTFQIKPKAGQEHGGLWNTSVYRIVSSSSSAPLTSGSQVGMLISGLQIENTSSAARGVHISRGYGGLGPNATVERCIFKMGGTSGSAGAIQIQRDDSQGVCRVRNNLMIASSSNAMGFDLGLGGAAGATTYVDNNTFIHTGSPSYAGIQRTAGTVVARNNIVKGYSNAYNGTFASGTDYNACDIADTPGVGSNNLQNQSFSFVDEAGGDYRLTNSLAGVDLSSDFTDDIIGTPRPQGGEWDIGCFERISPPSFIPQAILVA